MKKIFSLVLPALAILALGACDIVPQPNPDASGSQYAAAPELEIMSRNVVFNPQGGSGYIVANVSGTLSATSDRPWITPTVNGNRVDLSVNPNETLESRYATITLRSGSLVAEVIAQQFGFKSDLVWEETYTIPYEGATLALPFEENGTVWVTVDGTWISADVADGAVQYIFERSIYNYERTGSSTVSIGDWERQIKFVQEANPTGLAPGEEPHDFTLQPLWTPLYVEPSDPDATVSTVGVDVEDATEAGKYFVRVIPEGEFISYGSDHQLLLNRCAEAWKAESPVLYRASSRIDIDKLSIGSYLIYAIGVGPDGGLDYNYAVASFKVTKVLSPYEKFLGTWSVLRGTFEDTWTIVEKEPGKSYTITGLEGGTQAFLGEYEITGEFNPEDNTIAIKTHLDLGEYTFTNSGTSHTVTMRLTGLITYNGNANVTVGGNYTICNVSLTGDGVFTATAGPDLTLQGASGSYPITGMRLNGLEGNSAWSFDSSTPYNFPFSATQLAQGEGSGDDPDDPDDPQPGSYEKWLGTWSSGEEDLTLIAEEKDKSFIIQGFGPFDVQALYDASAGTLQFVGQYLDEDDEFEYYFAGLDDGNYMELGDQTRNYLLATATLSADGKSAAIVTHEYDAVYDGTTYHEIIVQLTVWGVPADPDDRYVYTFEGIPKVAVPSTLKKASSASVTALRTASYDMRTREFVPLYKTFQAGPAVPYKRR